MKKILLGLTTTPGSDWREKIREIDKFNIKEIALFPTYLKPQERQILYGLLEKTSLENIAFVHLRNDFDLLEIDYLVRRYKVKFFNIHPTPNGINFLDIMSKYRNRIFIENLRDNIEDVERNVKKCGGLCIDFAHWEAAKINKTKSYARFPALVQNNKVGFCHISAILDKPKVFSWSEDNIPCYAYHTMGALRDLDYLKKYIDYLPEILGIELENSFEEQLKAKEYLSQLISSKLISKFKTMSSQT